LRAKNCSAVAVTVKFKLDENLPVSSAAILTSADQNVDIVTDEGLTGAPDHDVVAAATAAGRILISLDRGLGDIRAYPPSSHAGIVVLRLTDQSTTAATKPVSDLATLTNPDSLAGAVAVLKRGLLCIRSRPPQPRRYRHLVLVPRSD
jgi:predicted nuclease of predicted toxin-antitoxin system